MSHACSGTMEPHELHLQTAMRTKPRDLVKKKKSASVIHKWISAHVCHEAANPMTHANIYKLKFHIPFISILYYENFPFYKKSSCLDNGSSSYGVSLQFS